MPPPCNWPWTPTTRWGAGGKDGYELHWVGKREAPQRLCAAAKIVPYCPGQQTLGQHRQPADPGRQPGRYTLRLLRQSYFGKIKTDLHRPTPYNTQSDGFVATISRPNKRSAGLVGYAAGNMITSKTFTERARSGWVGLPYTRACCSRFAAR